MNNIVRELFLKQNNYTEPLFSHKKLKTFIKKLNKFIKIKQKKINTIVWKSPKRFAVNFLVEIQFANSMQITYRVDTDT